MSGYVIQGLDPAPFRQFYGLDHATLARHGVIRMPSDAEVGYPCRITLEDVRPGDDVLLLNHEHLPVESPYRSRHAIFVKEGAEKAARFENSVPKQLAIRLLSVRGFDDEGMMTDADVVEGRNLEALVDHMFRNPLTRYLHVHNAKRGCFAARVDRG